MDWREVRKRLTERAEDSADMQAVLCGEAAEAIKAAYVDGACAVRDHLQELVARSQNKREGNFFRAIEIAHDIVKRLESEP